MTRPNLPTHLGEDPKNILLAVSSRRTFSTEHRHVPEPLAFFRTLSVIRPHSVRLCTSEEHAALFHILLRVQPSLLNFPLFTSFLVYGNVTDGVKISDMSEF